MIALKILKQKNFMSKLLTTDLFDDFTVEEITIDTFNTFTIDGRIHKEFYKDSDTPEEVPKSEFSEWAKIRPIALSLIKGKHTPLGFKFILHLSDKDKLSILQESDMDIFPDQVSFGIGIKYSQGEVLITTGVSYTIFTLDKSAEKAWDEYVPSFLESNGIEADLL